MNSRRALERLFGDRAEIYLTRTSAEPAYHFDNWLVFGFFKLLHKLLPAVSQTTLNVFIRKAGWAMSGWIFLTMGLIVAGSDFLLGRYLAGLGPDGPALYYPAASGFRPRRSIASAGW